MAVSLATRVPRRTSPPGKLINLGTPVRSRPSDPARHQLRAALDTRLHTLLACEPGVLHALRIHGKRLRYTSELAATAGRKPVRRLVASTVAFQDLLGEHQDACVAQYRIRQLLDGLGDVASVAGRMAAGPIPSAGAGSPALTTSRRTRSEAASSLAKSPVGCTAARAGHDSSARRCTATPTRSSVAVSPTRMCRAPEGP